MASCPQPVRWLQGGQAGPVRPLLPGSGGVSYLVLRRALQTQSAAPSAQSPTLEGAGVPLLRLLRVSGAEVLALIPSSEGAHRGVWSHAMEFQNHSQTPPKTVVGLDQP